ncbi:MAG TPA: argininosuccinate lyase [Deltaproteobacteria bacterium]|jgi:argininosuccinate lyase|nr:argininosuccinate lyase [Deltaproteobacteria bacterium]HOI06287.1 argininosuccinate lyase [Deltaproteobacteria bacterium]
MKDKPWSGRFSEETDALVEEFTESVSIDANLYAQDIKGSIAHAAMLHAVGILSAEEKDAVVAGLEEILKDIEEGSFAFDPSLEDVHMNIESELTKRIGEAGKKLHTARSRNDQVATDLRLYVRDCTMEILRLLRGLMATLVDKAEAHVDTIIPGMTHLQHAQPVSFGHHLLAYFEMFLRDYGRFRDACVRLNFSPLGAAAFAGTPHPIDRFMTAEALGFEGPCRNSIDAVSDRDFACEAVFACSLAMMHLSRLAEEMVIWSSKPYSFVELPDRFCTGSSIMPQKKNPDVAELVRGKVGGVYGNLVALLTMMKALPLAYNRDMQEDKRPVMESLDTLMMSIEAMTGLLAGMEMNAAALKSSLNEGFITATDVADYLASKGVPFREAHRITGSMVSELLKRGRTLADLSVKDFRKFSETFREDIIEMVKPESSVDRRTSFGGTARDNVRGMILGARARLQELEDEA